MAINNITSEVYNRFWYHDHPTGCRAVVWFHESGVRCRGTLENTLAYVSEPWHWNGHESSAHTDYHGALDLYLFRISVCLMAAVKMTLPSTVITRGMS